MRRSRHEVWTSFFTFRYQLSAPSPARHRGRLRPPRLLAVYADRRSVRIAIELLAYPERGLGVSARRWLLLLPLAFAPCCRRKASGPGSGGGDMMVPGVAGRAVLLLIGITVRPVVEAGNGSECFPVLAVGHPSVPLGSNAPAYGGRRHHGRRRWGHRHQMLFLSASVFPGPRGHWPGPKRAPAG